MKKLSFLSVVLLLLTICLPVFPATDVQAAKSNDMIGDVSYDKVWTIYASDTIDPTIDLNDYIHIENEKGERAPLFLDPQDTYVKVSAPSHFYERNGKYRLVVQPFYAQDGQQLTYGATQPFQIVDEPRSHTGVQLRKDSENVAMYTTFSHQIKEADIIDWTETTLTLPLDAPYQVGDEIHLSMEDEWFDQFIRITERQETKEHVLLTYALLEAEKVIQHIDISQRPEIDFSEVSDVASLSAHKKGAPTFRIKKNGFIADFKQHSITAAKQNIQLSGSFEFSIHTENSIIDFLNESNKLKDNLRLDVQTNSTLQVDGQSDLKMSEGLRIPFTDIFGIGTIQTKIKNIKYAFLKVEPYLYVYVDVEGKLQAKVQYETNLAVDLSSPTIEEVKVDKMTDASYMFDGTIEIGPSIDISLKLLNMNVAGIDYGAHNIVHASDRTLSKLTNSKQPSPRCRQLRVGTVIPVKIYYGPMEQNIPYVYPVRHISWKENKNDCQFANSRFHVAGQPLDATVPLIQLSKEKNNSVKYELLVDHVDQQSKKKTTYKVDPSLYQVIDSGPFLTVEPRVSKGGPYFKAVPLNHAGVNSHVDYRFTEEYFPLHDLNRNGYITSDVRIELKDKKGPVVPGESVLLYSSKHSDVAAMLVEIEALGKQKPKYDFIRYNKPLEIGYLGHGMNISTSPLALSTSPTGFLVLTNRGSEPFDLSHIKGEGTLIKKESLTPATTTYTVQPGEIVSLTPNYSKFVQKFEIHLQDKNKPTKLKEYARSLHGHLSIVERELTGIYYNSSIYKQNTHFIVNEGNAPFTMMYPYEEFTVLHHEQDELPQ